ncbi:8644_t:CDS:2 [Ambispora leptoticha]|uniref:8644_t:CDS:1 n=1 Tax=Ambispora leptoticha TaxID=144679 RepID=A0A9N9CYG2_9GLOM|nr:8644_t:CDS:2 [Ambispora leptoticha]
MTIDQNIKKKVKKFLEKYAQEHGQPDPSQKYARKIAVEVRSSGEIIFLPTEMSYKSVHHDFVISVGEESNLKSLKYEAFRRLWHELAPNVKIRKPRTDFEIFFDNPRKAELFGFQNKATGVQLNYILNEGETIGKGSNGTLSLVFDGIKRFNKGEKYLKLSCDNAPGQNKNNATIRFLFYLTICGYYETIGLDFMIAGHTKSRVDGNIGMAKRRYKKSTIEEFKQLVEVVEKSSPTGLNKTQCYENGKGFQYYKIKETLGNYFIKLSNIAKYHHFFFSSFNLGVVKVKESVDSKWKEFDLLKTEGKEREKVIEKIRNLVFHISEPKPLSQKRLTDFYKILPLLPKEY